MTNYYSKYQKYKNRYVELMKSIMKGGYNFNSLIPCMSNRLYDQIMRAKINKFGEKLLATKESLDLQNTLDEFTIMYNNEVTTFKKSRFIAEGGYGQVWEYTCDYHGKPSVVCVKIGKLARESTISQWLGTRIDQLDVHSGRIYECKYKYISRMHPGSPLNGTHIFMMELMDGNLQSFVEYTRTLSPITKAISVFLIMLGITRMFIQIHKKGYIYTDSKIENILFKCNKSNYVVKLGDLGGLSKIGERGVYTYRSKFNSSKIAMLYDFAYGLHIILTELLEFDKSYLNLQPSHYAIIINSSLGDILDHSDLTDFVNLINQQAPTNINDPLLLFNIDRIIIKILRYLQKLNNFVIPYHYIGYDDQWDQQIQESDQEKQWEGDTKLGSFMHKHELDAYTSILIFNGYEDLEDVLYDINYVQSLISVPPDGDDSKFINMYHELVQLFPAINSHPDYFLQTRLDNI